MMPWARHPVVGSGHVDEAARMATYQLSWFGADLHQTTDLQSDRIELRQEAPGFQASQVLNRQP